MLFGHQDDVKQPSTPAPSAPDFSAPQNPNPGVNPLAVDTATGASLPAVSPTSAGPVDTTNEPSVLNQSPAPNVGGETSTPDPGTPFSSTPVITPQPTLDHDQEDREAASIAASLDTPRVDQSPVLTAPEQPTTAPDPVPGSSSVFGNDQGNDSAAPVPGSESLLDLKQQAISQLGPLVGHLDQSPEEKFRTTMMLIQTTDNSTLLKSAYEIAQMIPDEKARAQALLDIVNEINYFTQQHSQNQ
jgi:hypothetical protein